MFIFSRFTSLLCVCACIYDTSIKFTKTEKGGRDPKPKTEILTLQSLLGATPLTLGLESWISSERVGGDARMGTQVLGMWEQGQGLLWLSAVPLSFTGLGEGLLSQEVARSVLAKFMKWPGGKGGEVNPLLAGVCPFGLEKQQNLAGAAALCTEILTALTATRCLQNISISRTAPAWKVSGIHWAMSSSFHMAVICC